MKKGYKITGIILVPLVLLSVFIYIKLKPIRELNAISAYRGTTDFNWTIPVPDSQKKTVIIMADNAMTELFDFLTPYYLFNETGRANVYIVAQKKFPIGTRKGPFILPHFTYKEIDSLNMVPNAIVIPFMNEPDSEDKRAWLRKKFTDSTIILTVCDGAWTGASSGIYDKVPMTSHATGHEKLRKKYPNPAWIQDVRYTHKGNLFSTGGVSNATDGSLAVIEKMFGRETMERLLKRVKYPHDSLINTHASNTLNGSAKLSVLKKLIFKKNRNLAIFLEDGVNEMVLAAVFDVYSRSLPGCIRSYAAGKKYITTQHGLTVLTDSSLQGDMDEIHFLASSGARFVNGDEFKNAVPVFYPGKDPEYIIDKCLDRIKKDYGQGFCDFVKRTLDYN